jgi:hypothetical protein
MIERNPLFSAETNATVRLRSAIAPRFPSWKLAYRSADALDMIRNETDRAPVVVPLRRA